MAGAAWGPPLLVAVGGALLAGLATAIALISALPRTDARGLLRRARWRAVLAVVAAVLWVGPLPFGPALPAATHQRIDWSLAYQAGAAGAVLAAIGAVWWAAALAQVAVDRGLRRAFGRRVRQLLGRAAHGTTSVATTGGENAPANAPHAVNAAVTR